MNELLKETPAEFVPGEMSEGALRKNLRFVADRDREVLARFVPVMRDGGGISMTHETDMPNYPRDGALANNLVSNIGALPGARKTET